MATILKNDSPDSAAHTGALREATFLFSDMSLQGDEYVRAVQAEAAKEVQRANAEAAQIRSRAEAEGRAAAEAAIDQLIDRRLAEQMTTLVPALRQLADSKGEWLAHWQSCSLEVARAMAERIVRKELSNDPQVSLQWIRESLELASGASEVVVRLNPNDHNGLRKEVDSLVQSMAGISSATVVADESVSPGGCLVETKHGAIDMQLESQLSRLVEELS